MRLDLRQRLAQFRAFRLREEPLRLADESRWYTEHTALLISTLKWALLGAGAGLCVGLSTRVFLWLLVRSAELARAMTLGRLPVFFLLPLAWHSGDRSAKRVRPRRLAPRSPVCSPMYCVCAMKIADAW